jgi:hypothetical protein
MVHGFSTHSEWTEYMRLIGDQENAASSAMPPRKEILGWVLFEIILELGLVLRVTWGDLRSLGFWDEYVLGHMKSWNMKKLGRNFTRMSESLHENNRREGVQGEGKSHYRRRASLRQAFCSLTLILLQKMTTAINTHVRVYMMAYDDVVLEMHAISRG